MSTDFEDRPQKPWHADVSYRNLTWTEWVGIDVRFSDIRNYLKCSRSEAIRKIFDAGMIIIENEMEESGFDGTEEGKIARKIHENQRARYRKWGYKTVYKSGDDALEWAEKEGLSDNLKQAVADEYSIEALETPLLPWHEKADEFLKQLLSDGPKKTVDVWSAALSKGIMESNADKTRLTGIAARKGYLTGDYGIWGLPDDK